MSVDNRRSATLIQTLSDKYNDSDRNDTLFQEEHLKPYVVELFKDLARRCKQITSKRSLDKSTFVEYSQLPFLVAERLFSIFTQGDDRMSERAFLRGLIKIFSSDIDTKLKLAFSM